MRLKEAKDIIDREHPDWTSSKKIQAIKELRDLDRVTDPDSHHVRWTTCQQDVAAAHPELAGKSLSKETMTEWRARCDADKIKNRAAAKAVRAEHDAAIDTKWADRHDRWSERLSATEGKVPTSQDPNHEPARGFVILGVLFVIASILLMTFTATGSILLLGAIISFVRASRAHKRNLQRLVNASQSTPN